MKLLMSILILVLIASCTSNSSRSNRNNNGSNYQETKLTLEEQEKMNPLQFLSISGNYKKNILGEWVIRGEISNRASIAIYKDATVKVNYYTKTNTFIGSEKHQIIEYFKPGISKAFKVKSFGYKNSAKLDLELVGVVGE